MTAATWCGHDRYRRSTNMMVGMTLVLCADLLPRKRCAQAVIVALTIPLSLLFAFILLHGEAAANLLSIGAMISGSSSTHRRHDG